MKRMGRNKEYLLNSIHCTVRFFLPDLRIRRTRAVFFFFKPCLISVPLVFQNITVKFSEFKVICAFVSFVLFCLFSLTETSNHETRPKILYQGLSYLNSWRECKSSKVPFLFAQLKKQVKGFILSLPSLLLNTRKYLLLTGQAEV